MIFNSGFNLLSIYNYAKKSVNESGYIDEGYWQQSLHYDNFTETDLLRESAWVILNSGFKEEIVRKSFNYISLCFCDWESSKAVLMNKQLCIDTALSKINNKKKIYSIVDIASIIERTGFDNLKTKIIENPIVELQKLPFIGRVTSYHLAKNLGFPIAKPDRHLVRIANYFGYDDVQMLCSNISETTGDSIPYVDIILWRFAVLNNQSFK